MFRQFNTLIVLGTILSSLATSSQGADVKLQSADGAFALSGELIEFDGEAYILKSVFGEVRIEANAVVCTGEECPDLTTYNNTFMLASTGAVGTNLLPALLEGFGKESGYQPQLGDGMRVEMLTEAGEVAAEISLTSGEESIGFAALADGSAALVIAPRSPEESEIAAITDAGFGDITSVEQQSVLAMDAQVILVSQDNPVTTISMEQAGGIFSGKITNWNALGGPDAAINVYRQNVDSGASDFLLLKFLHPSVSNSRKRHRLYPAMAIFRKE